jgi:hypothetical protein
VDHSVDIVTVAQAAHWFDTDAFYTQARRVLKKKQVDISESSASDESTSSSPKATRSVTVLDGTLAMWGYGFNRFKDHPSWTRDLYHYGTVTLHKYWDPRRVILDGMYADLPMPPTEADKRVEEEGLPTFTVMERRVYPSDEHPEVMMKKQITMRALSNYLKTWSAYKTFMDEKRAQTRAGEEMLDPVDALLEGWFLEAEGKVNYDTVVDVEWPVVLVLAK